MKRSLLALAALTVVFAAPARAADEKVVNLYIWSDYGDSVLKGFTEETGIKVNVDYFSSNEELDAKLAAGSSGYDLVLPTGSPFFARQVKSGIHRELDKAQIPNLANLDPTLMAQVATADAGNAHGAIYLWGTNGIGYNKDQVAKAMPNAPVDSLAMIFDPNVVKNFKDCGVALLDSPSEIYPVVAKYLGHDPASEDPAVLKAVEERLLAIRPYIRYFNSQQYIADLANGDICVAWGYNGDVFQAVSRAEEAKNGQNIAYSIPKEGSLLWFDVLAVPADAPHADNAMKLINYILKPETSAAISNAVSYANANTKAFDLVDEAVRTNPGVYPTDELKANLFLQPLKSPGYVKSETRSWQKVKSGT